MTPRPNGPVNHPHRLRIGKLIFTTKWGSWGCSRGSIGFFGATGPLHAYRSLRRAERDHVAEAEAALYREKCRKTGVCPQCFDTGHVCENHPDRPWGGMCCDTGTKGACEHGSCGCGAGMPCPAC